MSSSLKDSTIINQVEDEPDTIPVTLAEGTVVKIFVCGVIGVEDVTQLELFKRIIFEGTINFDHLFLKIPIFDCSESTYGSACAALYNSLDVRVLEYVIYRFVCTYSKEGKQSMKMQKRFLGRWS